ncbi:MAG: AAA family ATPase, partial [Planctomycetota bacterium]
IEQNDLPTARQKYLQAAELYCLLAQQNPSKTHSHQLLQHALRLKKQAQQLQEQQNLEDFPHASQLLQEAQDQEKLAQLAKEENDPQDAKLHLLKATECYLKLAEIPSLPQREYYLLKAKETKAAAQKLKTPQPPTSPLSTLPNHDPSQPLRAEFLLKRANEYEKRGLDARDEGQTRRAIFCLNKAAELLEQLANVSSPKLKNARQQKAQRLKNIAQELEGNSNKQPQKQSDKNDTTEKSTFIPVEKPTITFEDIAGLETVKEEVRRKMLLPFQFPEQAERFGIKKGGGILLYGPPGTGKTMIAQAIAAEIDAAFFTVRPSEIMSKWVGDAEKNVNQLFETAHKEERSIIFIDEIEALVPSRRENDSNVMQRLVPQILSELEGFGAQNKNPLLFLGATNEPWSLDPAILRPGRFDVKIYVGLPDYPAILKLLELNLQNKPLAEDVNFEEIAKILSKRLFSGADIKNICLRAATEAFVASVETGQEVAISQKNLLQIIENTKPSINKEDLQRFLDYAQNH